MSPARRVCLVPPADLLPDSGSTLYSRLLAESLSEAGCGVTVVCARAPAALKAHTLVAPIPLRHPFDHDHRYDRTAIAQSIAVTVHAVLTEWRPRPGDVVHAVYAGYTAVAASLVSALSDTTLIVSELGRMVNLAAPASRRDRQLARMGLSGAHHVIAATAPIADRIAREYGVDGRRLSVLPVPNDFRPFTIAAARPGRARHPGSAVVLTTICSCVTPEKGVLELIEAYAALRARVRSAVRLQIVGADPVAGEPTLTQVREAVERHGMQDDVALLGYRPHGEIPGILAGTDVYVDARRAGNFSSVIWEAMAIGCPVVASAVESTTAVLEHDVDAVLWNPRAPESLVEALQRAIEDPELRRRLQRNAPSWFARQEEALSPRAHAGAVMAIYDRLAEPAGDQPGPPVSAP